jgi:hypothetical protein
MFQVPPFGQNLTHESFGSLLYQAAFNPGPLAKTNPFGVVDPIQAPQPTPIASGHVQAPHLPLAALPTARRPATRLRCRYPKCTRDFIRRSDRDYHETAVH